jgi:hypothetical protein
VEQPASRARSDSAAAARKRRYGTSSILPSGGR